MEDFYNENLLSLENGRKICRRLRSHISGSGEDDCMYKLIRLQDNHGELTWYSGYEDEDYSGGEYIGRENFIYS